jgi:hypothetical protein
MKKLLFVLFALMLSGCSGLSIWTTPVEKPKLNIADPEPLQLDGVTFLVVTKENALAVLNDLEKKGLKPVIIGLSGKDYKVLALDINKIQNYIATLEEIIKKYREYYEGK